MIMPSGRGIPFYILLLALLWPTLVSAISIELVPSSSEVVPGDVLTVQAIVSGLASPGSPSLSAYDVTVQFDPALFAHQSSSSSGNLGTPTLTSLNLANGAVNFAEVSLLPLGELDANQGAGFVMFTTRLNVIGFTNARVEIGLDGRLSADNGTPLAVSVVPVDIKTLDPARPVPALSWMFLLLLILLIPLTLHLANKEPRHL
jgi:hypothetical protein